MFKVTKIGILSLLSCTLFNSFAEVKYYPSANENMPFSQATQVDNIVYLSGQIANDENGKLADNITDQSHQVMKNIDATLKGIGLTMDDVFKCTVMIEDIEKWSDFNKVYVTYFNPKKLPSRSAFGADGLAMGSMLELECWAYANN
ncbi:MULTISPECIES: RidA family protein [Alteromonadaceae]|uniref:RidA family protein n=1 Tax=Alteromonadaceae TaxID=72275 RepID=UPI001C09DC55|nr:MULTISPECIES: RidA family protein [Aliiglaciecola]MBU2878555.1 RidA family protein [Aliiglaciecola lipolytica]MDO6709617.1 RidA family protein [Aliiglaciecola sp. 2_MG-2023]MDO6750841.1 RidA family protein [Aliiglaciecola sp. 1_MG-2023]